MKLALLGAFFALPFVARSARLLLVWAPGATCNYGELIEPPPAASALAAPTAPFGFATRGQVGAGEVDAGACDAACQRKLYFMRQVRRAQGKDMDRVERVWLVDRRGAPPRRRCRATIEGTRSSRAPARACCAAAGGERPCRDHIYLVDPLGNLMMRFPRDADPRG